MPQREWISLLRNSDPDPVKNPTKKLLEFFEEKYDHDGMSRKGLAFETTITQAQSETLQGGFEVIGSGLIRKMVKEWVKVWREGESS